MTASAADEIRKKQRIRHLLADIVENLDYLQELQRKKFGMKSRFIVLNDIKSVHKVGSKGLNLVSAEFNSELGNLSLVIAIKRFSSADEAFHNKLLTNRLAEKLANTGVFTPRVIFDHGTTLIYEGIQGETFIDAEIEPDSYKFILAGDALSRFHSPELRPVDPQRYVHILKTVLQELRLPDDRLREFVDMGGDLMNKSLVYNSGTAAFGDFHPGNILFSIDEHEANENRIKTWLIDPEYTEEAKTSDRMEDIGTFFLYQAIDLYEKKGNLKGILGKLESFLQGYDRVLNYYGISLNTIYSGNLETVFIFHLGINVLLEALYLQKRGNLNVKAIFNRWKTCISLANYLWKVGLS